VTLGVGAWGQFAWGDDGLPSVAPPTPEPPVTPSESIGGWFGSNWFRSNHFANNWFGGASVEEPRRSGTLKALPIEWVEAQRREEITADDILLLMAGAVAAHLLRQ